MKKPEKYSTIKMILSAIATIAGIILVGSKTYSHVGMILLSFGSIVLALTLRARTKEITSDELTEWIDGKSAVLAFWATYSTIVLLLALDLYRPNFFETWIALGIVMIAAVGALFFGEYYYGKVRKDMGF
ncbi:MAG TPA: hypothetical protein VIO11_11510 [Candidatus Methanoperedens sp.]